MTNSLFGRLAAVACVVASTACGASSTIDDGHSATVLESLSTADAPLATGDIFWGTAIVEAPGVAVPDDPRIVVILDGQHLRYIGLGGKGSGAMIAAAFGDTENKFPLTTGTRTIDGIASASQVEIVSPPTIEQSWPTRTISLTYRLSGSAAGPGTTSLLTTVEAHETAAGWKVDIAQAGEGGLSFPIHATAMVQPGSVELPTEHATRWESPIMMTAPDFLGDGVDSLSLTFDASGVPTEFAFNNFFRSDTLPAAACPNVVRDVTAAPTADHFVFRYTCEHGAQVLTEGLEGNKIGGRWAVRYFAKGTWAGAAVDARAFGTLSPSH